MRSQNITNFRTTLLTPTNSNQTVASRYIGYLGSVNRWECDENDHLNVRFFQQRALDATTSLIADSSWLREGHTPALIAQHVRYVKEARVAYPLRGEVGVVACSGTDIHFSCSLTSPLDGEVHAHVSSIWRDTDPQNDTFGIDAAVLEKLLRYQVNLPDAGARRGVQERLLASLPNLEDAKHGANGEHMIDLSAGVVAENECDTSGSMEPYRYIGKVSDGMPNLIAAYLGTDGIAQRADGIRGGAVLENNIRFHGALRAGDSYLVRSGIRSVGRKTHNIVHWMFNRSTGALVYSCEAVAIAMDLTTRRSMEIPPEQRLNMEAMCLPELAV